MKKLITFFALLTFFVAMAQANEKIDNFTYLQSQGAIPARLLESLNSDDDEAKVVQSLVKNGRLIYGTELNSYVETVAANLLEKNQDLFKKLSFYIVKSPSVNAMISNKGIVLVNLGMLAQITNESELAFILGHEISHFVENEGKKKKSTKIVSLNSYLSYRQNSREDELEADKQSLERYFNASPYSLQAIENVFDVMRYGYLPFDEIPFTRAEVEQPFYQYPDNYFLANVKQIRSRADYVDTLSTHPNLQKRQQNLDRFIERNTDSGSEFVQSKETFLYVRDLARLECINFYLTWHDYGSALANILALRHYLPNNRFLEIAEAAAYYGFHKHKNDGNIKDVVEPYKEIEGEKQQICYFLSKINKKEANTLAVRKLTSIIKKYPDSNFLRRMAADAMYDLTKENNLNLEDFSDFAQGLNADSIKATLQINDTAKIDEKKDKYSRIRVKKGTKQLVLPNEKFKTLNYMLVDIKQDSIFQSLYDNALAEIEDEEALAIVSFEKPVIQANDRVLVWMPQYAKYKPKTQTTTYPKVGNATLKSAIKSSTKSLHIAADVFTEDKLKSRDTEEFNRISLVGQWRTEWRQISFRRMQMYMQPALQTGFATSDYRFINLVNEGGERGGSAGYKWSILYRAPLCWVTLPFDLLIVAIPKMDKTLYFSLYDIEKGEMIVSKKYEQSEIDADAYLNQALYNYYYTLKNGRKITGK
ncbi:MAG: M48 family metallopeptidase [Paludibacter sp.]|jgi:Zn-dependent protease with chaperone function|nr:M48 family metallopeptidase [Paludibacter sp.]